MIINEEKRQQTMSYIVHAGEIFKKDNHFPKNSYKYAYLPTGPELYTGVLKAAGYLFLEKKLENIVFIVDQTDYPKQIISYVDDKNILFLGRNIKNDGLKITRKKMPITLELYEQLLYVRLMTKIKSVIILGVGSNVSRTKIFEKINEIGYFDFGVVILGKSSEESKSNISKDQDKTIIKHMLTKKEYKQNPNWLGNTYIDIIKHKKGKPELVAYINSSDLGIKKERQIGYICMVA